MSSATYRSLLRTPGAAAFFLTATVGRIGIAMTGLGLVWLVHGFTGSYATAGLVTGAFAVAEALVGPQLARLVDRFGQSRVLPPAVFAHAAAVATLLVLLAGDAARWQLTAAGALAGATVPQLGALSAARWAALLTGDRTEELPTAFALESVGNATAFLAGPVLVSTLGATGHPALGSGLAATLIVAGGLALATQRRTAPRVLDSTAEERAHADRSLLRPAFLLLAGLHLVIGGYFGAMRVSMTAFPAQHGAAELTGLIFLVSSCSGLLAGWLYGLRRWRADPRRQLLLATAGLTLGGLLLLAAGSVLQLGFVIVVTGAAIPPMLVLLSVLTQSTVHRAALTQAFAWQNSTSAAGTAGASAVSGWAVDAYNADGGFALATATAALMTVAALIGLRVFRSSRSLPPSPKVSADSLTGK